MFRASINTKTTHSAQSKTNQPRRSYSRKSTTGKPYSFVHSLDAHKVNYAQTHLNQQIANHLRANRGAPHLITAFEQEGFCQGYTAFALHGLWLESQPLHYAKDRKSVSRLDAQWYWDFLKKTSQLHTQTLSQFDTMFLNAFITKLTYLQKIYEYTPNFLQQGDFEKSFPSVFQANIKRDFSLVGAFSADDFLKPIYIRRKKHATTLIKELVKKNRMVLISIPNHDTGLFLHDHYYYYNSNDKNGLHQSNKNQTCQLVKYIFNSHDLSENRSALFAFRIFAGWDAHDEYIDQSDLLTAVGAAKSKTNSNKALYHAAKFGCAKSAKYYLDSGADVNYVEYPHQQTSLHIAAGRNYPEVVKVLLDHPHIRTDLCNDKNMTAAQLAAFFGNETIASLLSQHNYRKMSATFFANKSRKLITAGAEINSPSQAPTKKPS